jgi:choice-of-anchor C domain-containing protein
MRFPTPLFAAIALLGTSSVAGAATIINGSFELSGNPNATSPAFTELSPGSLEIAGWTVGGLGVDLVGSNYWTASEGIQSVDLSRRGAGSISQTFDTVIGASYLVTFDLSGNPFGGIDDKISVITFSGNAPIEQIYAVTAVNSPTNMLWETYGFNFVATGITSTLTFASSENSRFGPALDNVNIADGGGGAGSFVPEPSAWAMMVLGFGLVGVSTRRRQGRVVAA